MANPNSNTNTNLQDLRTQLLANLAYFDKNIQHPRYTHTGRPITRMETLISSPPLNHKNNNLFLPVVRYANLYHSTVSRDTRICGTFYYYEPQSEILLNLGVTAVFGSKVHAYYKMKEQLQQIVEQDYLPFSTNLAFLDQLKRMEPTSFDKFKERFTTTVSQMKAIFDWFTILEPHNYERLLQIPGWKSISDMLTFHHGSHDFRYIVDRCMIPFYNTILRNSNDVTQLFCVETTPLYPSDRSDFWNESNMEPDSHDYLDQAICWFGRLLGLDTIILQHEIGETRSVTEILDVRSDTYQFLTQVNPRPWFETIPSFSYKYPTIWFVDYGFVSNFSPSSQFDIFHDFIIDSNDANIVKPASIQKIRHFPLPTQQQIQFQTRLSQI